LKNWTSRQVGILKKAQWQISVTAGGSEKGIIFWVVFYKV